MAIALKIDNRENTIIDLFKNEEEFEISQLDLGDFQILYKNEIRFIIERKTLSDLQSSIMDNRYKEQKLRSLAFCKANNCKYLYIIEGDRSFQKLSANSLGAILNSVFRDSIPIIMSTSPLDTCFILKNILDRMKADTKKYFENKSEIYQDTIVKQRKKDNIDINVAFMMQLCAIPGISSTKAKQIIDAKKVTNIFELCNQMSKVQPDIFFAEIKGVGKKLSRAIYTFCGISAQDG